MGLIALAADAPPQAHARLGLVTTTHPTQLLIEVGWSLVVLTPAPERSYSPLEAAALVSYLAVPPTLVAPSPPETPSQLGSARILELPPGTAHPVGAPQQLPPSTDDALAVPDSDLVANGPR